MAEGMWMRKPGSDVRHLANMCRFTDVVGTTADGRDRVRYRAMCAWGDQYRTRGDVTSNPVIPPDEVGRFRPCLHCITRLQNRIAYLTRVLDDAQADTEAAAA